MFWSLLFVFYIITFPFNALLLNKVWYKWYPIHNFEMLGEAVDQIIIMRAQLRAILLFGVLQPILASVPLLFGGQWWHYIICFLATVAYSASGSAKFYLDRVRSSHLMRIGTVISFVAGALIFTLIR